jgi:TetR/AcrR family transcriptional regulator, transcriptional repressor for nem operon
MNTALPDSRTRVLDAALHVLRAQGYCATTVDHICATAGVNKGSFFHHFKSKEEMALAAVAHWNTLTGGLFANAPYQQLADPRDRVLAYLDFRKELLRGEAPDYTCLLGTIVQETYGTHPRLREACDAGIAAHAATVARDIAAAKALHAPEATWDAGVLALFTQAALQGAFVLAKAQGSAKIAGHCVDHLRQHVAQLLNLPPTSPRGSRAAAADRRPTPPRKRP